MATVTHRIATTSTSNTNTYASGSFTPTAGDLLVVFAVASGTVAAGGATASANGITFTKVTSTTKNASADTLYCYIADQKVGPSPSAMTVTVTTTGDSATGCAIFVASVAGMTRAGTAAIRQSAVQANQTSGTPTVTFSSAVLTGNPTLGFVGNAASPAGMTAPVGWTEDAAGDTGYSTPTTGAEYVYRNSGYTGTSITWASSSSTAFGALGIELDTSNTVISQTVNQVTETDSINITRVTPGVYGVSHASTTTGSIATSQPTGSGTLAYEMAFMTVCTASATPGTPPFGWQVLSDQSITDAGGDSTRIVIYDHDPQATPGSATFTHSATTRQGAVTRIGFTDVDVTGGNYDSLTTPVTDGVVGTSHTTTSITPAGNKRLVLGYAVMDGAASPTWTPPSGWTEQADYIDGSAGDITSITMATIAVDTAVATSGTFVATDTDEAIVGAVAIKPITTAQPAATPRKSKTLGQPAETETAQVITPTKSSPSIHVNVNQASETDTVQPVTHTKAKSFGQINEIDQVQPVKLTKLITVHQVSEVDQAQPITVRISRRYVTVNQVTETELAQPVGRLHSKIFSSALEADATQTVVHRKSSGLGQNTETETAQPFTLQRSHSISQISDTELAQPIRARKTKTIGQPSDTELVQSLTHRKAKAIGQPVQSSLSQPATRVKSRSLGQPTETDLAQPVSAPGHIYGTINQVVEADSAQPMGKVDPIWIGVTQPAETDLAQSITPRLTHRYITLGQAIEADLAQSISTSARRYIPVNQVIATELVQPLSHAKAKEFTQLVEVDEAFGVFLPKFVPINQAVEQDLAQTWINTSARRNITWHVSRGQGHQLTVRVVPDRKMSVGASGHRLTVSLEE